MYTDNDLIHKQRVVERLLCEAGSDVEDDVEAVVVARALEGLFVALVAGVEGAARVAVVRAGAARQGFVLGQRERAPLVQRVRAPLDDTKNL